MYLKNFAHFYNFLYAFSAFTTLYHLNTWAVTKSNQIGFELVLSLIVAKKIYLDSILGTINKRCGTSWHQLKNPIDWNS
jgi:hypothetical protein